MATAADLRRRWYEPERAGLHVAVRAWLMGGAPKPSGLGEIDNRVDLRGIPLLSTPVVIGDASEPASGVLWESLDFRRASGAEFSFYGARIENCLFDSATLTDLRLHGTEFVDCSFRRADLRKWGGFAGAWHGRRNTWRRTDFGHAKLRNMTFENCVLDGCHFEQNGKRIVFEGCEILDCTFRGEWHSLLIESRGQASRDAFSADLSEASLTDSHILGYSLDHARLPEQAGLVVIRGYPPIARRAIAQLTNDTTNDAERTARAILSARLHGLADDSDACYDLRGLTPEVQETIRTALHPL